MTQAELLARLDQLAATWEQDAALTAITLCRLMLREHAAALRSLIAEAKADEPVNPCQSPHLHQDDSGGPESAVPAPSIEVVYARVEYCDRCDGCGWHEGGKTLQTTCEKCGGTGITKGATT